MNKTVLIFIATLIGVSSWLLWSPDQVASGPTYERPVSEVSRTTSELPEQQVAAVKQGTKPMNGAQKQDFQNLPSIHVQVNNDKYEVASTNTLSVIEAMHEIAKSDLAFTYTVKHFPGLGDFVSSINGISPKPGESWILLINNATSTLGASSVRVRPNDSISWVLDKTY